MNSKIMHYFNRTGAFTVMPARRVWQYAREKGPEAPREAGPESTPDQLGRALKMLEVRIESVGGKIRKIEEKAPDSRTATDNEYLRKFREELARLELRRRKYLASEQRAATLGQLNETLNKNA